MKHAFILTLVLLNYTNTLVYTEQLLITFLQHYPQTLDIQAAHVFVHHLRHPSTTAQSTAKSTKEGYSLAGIMATYAGFLTVSDNNGQLSFPLRHDATSVSIAITPLITPITMLSNTVHHWQFEEGTPAKLYVVERKLDNETAITYWHTTELPLPHNDEIPLEALILFAHPDDIYVPVGITPIQQTPHFVLPAMYLRRGKNVDEEALYVLNLRLFFGPILKMYQKQPTSLQEHITH